MGAKFEIDRQSLQQRVMERLRGLLIEGEIEPGSKLNERELCERLCVSRTPLREAIRGLAAEGLVVLQPNRGAYALELSVQDVADSFELMAELEGFAGELAAQRISAQELAELRALQFEMQACFERRDLAGYYRLNGRIHAFLNAAARNPVLSAHWQQLNARLHALRFRSNQDERKWAQAIAEHGEMLEALQARDGARLRGLLRQHLLRKRDVVLAQLAQRDTGQT